MVNVGHPSQGCLRCRQLKVKCDTERPACGRCQRTGQECPGYARSHEARFRSMNRSSEVKVRNRIRQRLGDRDESPGSSSGPPPPLAIVQRQPRALVAPGITRPMSIDWESQSVDLLFAEWVEGPDSLHSYWGSWTELPDMYQSGSPHLTEAVKATALANLRNVSSIQQFDVMAKNSYGKALVSLGRAMRTSKTAFTKETLQAVSTLAIYELIAGEAQFKEIFHNHFQGQSAVLHALSRNSGKTPLSGSLIAMTNRVLIWRDLATLDAGGLPKCDLALRDWPLNLYPSHLAEVSARLSVRVLDTCTRLRKEMFAPADVVEDEQSRNVELVAAEILKLDREVQDCYASESDQWQPQRGAKLNDNPPSMFLKPELPKLANMLWSVADWALVPELDISDEVAPQSIGHRPKYPSRIDSYPSRSVATLWTNVRVLRLYLLRALVDIWIWKSQRYVELGIELPKPTMLYRELSSTVEDICASVPYLLGNVDEQGNFRAHEGRKSLKPTAMTALIWSLHRLCRIPGLDPKLRSWIYDVFTVIGGTGGLKVALSIRRIHEEGV